MDARLRSHSANDPPSEPVSILETAAAEEEPGGWHGSGPDPSPSGAVNNGCNDPVVVDARGYQCTGAHLLQRDGSSGTIVLDAVTLSASNPTSTWTGSGPDWDGSGAEGPYPGSATVNLNVQLIAASLQAHSTIDTSAPGNPWDPTHPRFFSGTNCSATGVAVATSGYVSHAELLVGGTDVKDYYDTSFVGPIQQGATTGTNQPSVPLTVHFDSTYFADGGNIPIQMLVTDTAGNKYDANVKANAYNKGYVGYEPTRTSYGQAIAANVDQVLAQSNIKNNDSTTSDTRDAVLAAVTTNTDFFTYNYGQHYPDSNNHLFFEPPAGVGNSNGVLYGSQSLDPTSTAQNPRNDIAEAVAAKGVNPHPYNFIYLDICNGGYNSEFADGFGVSASGNTDRAFLGWNGWVEDSEVNQNWTALLYAYLQSGQTLSAALMNADQIVGGPPQDNNTNSPNHGLACPHPVFGDSAMTLHGTVYQGAAGSWYR